MNITINLLYELEQKMKKWRVDFLKIDGLTLETKSSFDSFIEAWKYARELRLKMINNTSENIPILGKIKKTVRNRYYPSFETHGYIWHNNNYWIFLYDRFENLVLNEKKLELIKEYRPFNFDFTYLTRISPKLKIILDLCIVEYFEYISGRQNRWGTIDEILNNGHRYYNHDCLYQIGFKLIPGFLESDYKKQQQFNTRLRYSRELAAKKRSRL